MSKSLQTPPEMEDLADKIGEFIQYWGFKRVHGRIWTHLYLSPVPLDAQELIGRLKVSKALMSFSIHDLLKYKVIEEAGKSDRNTQLYRANSDILDVILNVLRRREKRLLSSVEASLGLFQETPGDPKKYVAVDPDRSQRLREMVETAQETLNSIVALKSVDFGLWQNLMK